LPRSRPGARGITVEVMSRDEKEIAQLEGWIENSLRFRRRLRVVAAVAAVIALAVWIAWSSTAGTVAVLIVGSIYGIGWWITFGHISDWRARIELLEQRQERAKS
jgi:amino acid transporter